MDDVRRSPTRLRRLALALVLVLATGGCATNTWVQGPNSTMSPAWDSGKAGTVLSADCMAAAGPLHFFAGLEGFKEPAGNLDRFIARLDIGCLEYRTNAGFGLAQTGDTTRITVTTTSDFRTDEGEVALGVGITGIPVGIRVVHGNKSYVQNLALMVGAVGLDADGNRTITGHGAPGATGTTIPDYPAPTGIAGPLGRSNSVRLDCPAPQVMTGIEITVDPTKDKIRRLRVMCHPVVFVGSAGS